jgi:guanyl-specific ribonuclease Sa
MTRADPAQALNTVGGYKEYAVRAPGIGNRGERRTVVNYQEKTVYYSHDHCRSFVDIAG